MHTLDYILILAYLAVLVALGLRKRLVATTGAAELILDGRRLTTVDEINMQWPSGVKQTVSKPEINRLLEITEAD